MALKYLKVERRVNTRIIEREPQDWWVGDEKDYARASLSLLDNIEKKLTKEELEYVEYIISAKVDLEILDKMYEKDL